MLAADCGRQDAGGVKGRDCDVETHENETCWQQIVEGRMLVELMEEIVMLKHMRMKLVGSRLWKAGRWWS